MRSDIKISGKISGKNKIQHLFVKQFLQKHLNHINLLILLKE
jgi:hypothetical protein